MMHRKFLALLALLLCLALSVPALAAEGLAAFQNPQNAQPGAFSDVPSGSWYAAGVQAVSRRGIMNGTGKTSFSPKQTVSWAQAVAIAARIHAACNDGEIAETGGAWYEPYIAYATEAKLLPSTCPDGSAVTAKTITRQELAGLFANVLRAEDLPAINDQTIPDLNAVDAEFREAVQRMYAAGVFTGIGITLNPMIASAAMSLSSVCVVTNALRLNTFDPRSAAHDAPPKRKAPVRASAPEIPCPTGSCPVQPAPENKTIQTEGTAMKKTIHIEGMMCGHCEATVKKALEALDGVQSAEVSHEKGTAVVSLTHDVADADLKTAVEARDYTVTGIDA